MTFSEFYREYYLPRHALPACRRLHLLGVPVAAAYGAAMIWLHHWWLLLLLPVPAYALGWLGHLVAHNRPTFLEHPALSFLGYWKMLGAMVRGELRTYRPPGAPGGADHSIREGGP